MFWQKILLMIFISISLLWGSAEAYRYGIHNFGLNEDSMESETTGSCSNQLSSELHKRNCRYGKCEQTKDGSDFTCHCDQFIAGKRCDTTTTDFSDPCSSNPCWGGSLCIISDSENFQCLCSRDRRGKYCQIRIADKSDQKKKQQNPAYVNFELLKSLGTSAFSTQTTHKKAASRFDYGNTQTSVVFTTDGPKMEQSTNITGRTISATTVDTKKTYIGTPAEAKNKINSIINKVDLSELLKDTNFLPSILTSQPTHDILATEYISTTEVFNPTTTTDATTTTLTTTTTTSTSTTTTTTATTTTTSTTTTSTTTTTTTTTSTTSTTTTATTTTATSTATTTTTSTTTTIATTTTTTTTITTTTTTTTTTTPITTSTTSTTTTSTTTIPSTTTTTTRKTTTETSTSLEPEPKRTAPQQTLRGLVDMKYLHDSQIRERCSFKNCKLGKCINEFTCECIYPAVGKYCDQVDECSMRKCKNGYCSEGKGCLCHHGYSGVNCEIANMSFKKNHIVSAKYPFYESTLAKLITKTQQPNLPQPSTVGSTSTHLPSRTTTTTTETTTTLNSIVNNRPEPKLLRVQRPEPNFQLNSCENGGYLIDGICLCINGFTGTECEIPPSQGDTTHKAPLTMTTATRITTKSALTEIANKIKHEIAKFKWSQTSAAQEMPLKVEKPEKDEFTVITINRKGRGGGTVRNITINRDLLWPWFECFPGNSMVTILGKDKIPRNISVSELNVNDHVLIGYHHNGGELYSKVVSFLHRIPDIDAKFVRLHFGQSGESITLTERHLILVKSNNDGFEYIPAARVQINDMLKTFNYNSNQFMEVNVVRIEAIDLENSGIFAPLTETGTLLVDGVQVSSYSMVKSHSLAQFFFNIFNKLGVLFQLTPDVYESVYRRLYSFVEVTHLKMYVLNIS